ncbi:unnamed protein product [Adineta steineri]|uniref:Uncharacterized protein n=1 Tax=Adineta steineri TaxID=433720 RepID=A0A815FW09_9BILA|nr:unnamed protein product [Adineta steineri]
MLFSHALLFITIGILCYYVQLVSTHAYFLYPTPRTVYCTNSSCTANGTLGPQGPVWGLTANSSLTAMSPTSQTTCNGSTLATAAPAGGSYDSGFKGTTAASWQAGSTQTLQIFISQIHSPENQTIYPTDGWQILYRDGAQANSTFYPINFIYVNVWTTSSVGPAPAIGFQLGQIVKATITVPSGPTTDGIFQFFWRNNEVGTGVMWLSCADVTITALGITQIPSIFCIVLAALLVITRVAVNV